MPILLLRSNVAGRIPSVGDLEIGELALNTVDGYLYYINEGSNRVESLKLREDKYYNVLPTSTIVMKPNTRYLITTPTVNTLEHRFPLNPIPGDFIMIGEIGGALNADKTVVLGGNGSSIHGEQTNFSIDIGNVMLTFIYIDETKGWMLTDYYKVPVRNG